MTSGGHDPQQNSKVHQFFERLHKTSVLADWLQAVNHSILLISVGADWNRVGLDKLLTENRL